jgi:hypothetical protein
VLVFIQVLGTLILVVIAAALGFRLGRRRADQDRAELRRQLAILKGVMDAAGLRLPGERPATASERTTAGSWTGMAVPEQLKPPPGSIPRFDEPRPRNK